MIIETHNLNFQFPGSKKGLGNINLQIPKGSIYGFLGQNGAGKTTTIRLLLGLLEPVSPSVRVFGERIEQNPIGIFARTGAFIESPSLYGHLSGFDNLRITALLKDIPEKRIHAVFELIGLSESKKVQVSKYSLGMKQRLALGLAILSEPELLILDEPTNGLDPLGIQQTRELLMMLNEDFGVTILISSHMLSEIEKMVSHLGILHEGKLVFQGRLSDLMEQHNFTPSLEQIYLSIVNN